MLACWLLEENAGMENADMFWCGAYRRLVHWDPASPGPDVCDGHKVQGGCRALPLHSGLGAGAPEAAAALQGECS